MNTRIRHEAPGRGRPASECREVCEAVCPKCGRWTPLDSSLCLMCGRLLPWLVTHRHLIASERSRRGLLSWVSHGGGYHLDWGGAETRKTVLGDRHRAGLISSHRPAAREREAE